MQRNLIKFNNKELKTMHDIYITDEEYGYIVSEYRKKPQKQEVIEQVKQVVEYGCYKLDKINRYFFRDLMDKVKMYDNKWTIEEVLECKELVAYFFNKTKTNDKMFPPDKDIFTNFKTVLRLGGKGVATNPSQFPIKIVDLILRKYNKNNNFYDFSCGWGVRMLGAFRQGVNYFGTDPNHMLVKRLEELKDMSNTKCYTEIRCQGSEEFIPEWENKMGLAFSSPPYFNLENYQIGNQSYKEGMLYEEWVNNYLEPTINNIYRYLIKDGVFAININNFNGYPLVEDTIKLAKAAGFNLVGEETLQNIKRTTYKGGHKNGDEKVFIFEKN